VHVYSEAACGSGPVLQPLDDACSEVTAYKSIMVAVDVPARLV
jgi:hypothetical protein